MHQSERIVRELAASQAGVFSRRQAIEVGMTVNVIRNRCRSEQFIALGRGVYGFPSHPDSHLRRLWIEHLAAGPDSVVSHESAARLHGVNEIEEFRTSLIVSRKRADTSLPSGHGTGWTTSYRPTSFESAGCRSRHRREPRWTWQRSYGSSDSIRRSNRWC